MSDDEVFVLLVSVLASTVLWGLWYFRALTVRLRPSPGLSRTILYAAPLLSVVILWAVLRTLASHDVRDSPAYLVFYVFLGAAWVGVALRFIPFVGMSVRDDALERQNPAAATAAAAAVLAITLCYAGANVGEGPGWWVVVFCAFLSTAGLFVTWLALAKLASNMDMVTIDRDLAASVRLAGFLIAVGLVLGRAVAGNWHSSKATVVDFFAVGWPAFLFPFIAAGVDRILRPTPEDPSPSVALCGVYPALAYVAAAFAYIWSLGLTALRGPLR